MAGHDISRSLPACPTDFAAWAKITKELRHFSATTHFVEVAPSGASFIPDNKKPKGIGQIGVSTLVERHRASEENDLKDYTILQQETWDAREVAANHSREHNSLMGPLELLRKEGLVILETEMPIGFTDLLVNLGREGEPPAWAIPVGKLDLLCLDSKGKLVLAEIKAAPRHVFNPLAFLARRTYAFQMELYSFLLERLAAQAGYKDLKVAYHLMLLWHPYATAKSSQGSAHLLRLKRNPDYWLHNKAKDAPFRPLVVKSLATE